VLLQGLVVPVLRNVETMNYADIEKGLNELGDKVCEHCDIIMLCDISVTMDIVITETFFLSEWTRFACSEWHNKIFFQIQGKSSASDVLLFWHAPLEVRSAKRRSGLF